MVAVQNCRVSVVERNPKLQNDVDCPAGVAPVGGVEVGTLTMLTSSEDSSFGKGHSYSVLDGESVLDGPVLVPGGFMALVYADGSVLLPDPQAAAVLGEHKARLLRRDIGVFEARHFVCNGQRVFEVSDVNQALGSSPYAVSLLRDGIWPAMEAFGREPVLIFWSQHAAIVWPLRAGSDTFRKAVLATAVPLDDLLQSDEIWLSLDSDACFDMFFRCFGAMSAGSLLEAPAENVRPTRRCATVCRTTMSAERAANFYGVIPSAFPMLGADLPLAFPAWAALWEHTLAHGGALIHFMQCQSVVGREVLGLAPRWARYGLQEPLFALHYGREVPVVGTSEAKAEFMLRRRGAYSDLALWLPPSEDLHDLIQKGADLASASSTCLTLWAPSLGVTQSFLPGGLLGQGNASRLGYGVGLEELAELDLIESVS